MASAACEETRLRGCGWLVGSGHSTDGDAPLHPGKCPSLLLKGQGVSRDGGSCRLGPRVEGQWAPQAGTACQGTAGPAGWDCTHSQRHQVQPTGQAQGCTVVAPAVREARQV